MKAKIFSILLFIFLFSCKKNPPAENAAWDKISERVYIQKDAEYLKLKSGKFTYDIERSKLPFKKIILLNSSLVGYFTELQADGNIIGISSPEYIFSNEIKQKIREGQILDIGNEQKYNVEKIISLKPDAIFTNYVATFENTYSVLRNNGIEIIFLDEYLEQNPLEKSKYLLVFGALLDKEALARLRYNSIENNYNILKQKAQKERVKPLVLANEIYGNQWFLPGGKTGLAQFIKDAGAQYINAENNDDKATPLSFEQVFAVSKNAEFWVNVGDHQKKAELLQINPNYSKMAVYQKGKIYGVNGSISGRSNDFFESGVVRADLVLQDYINIFHNDLLGYSKLRYMKLLK